MKTIIFTLRAAREFDALRPQARAAIESALITYATLATGDVKKLQGRDGYRMRVGLYRVLLSEDRMIILAVYIGRRTATIY